MNQGQLNNLDKSQMSEEQLQRTQVLNLDDFRDVARIERIGSKKPAIIVALIGIFSILAGTAFPAVQSYNARKEAANDREIRARKTETKTEEKKVVKESLVCNLGFLSVDRNVKENIKATFTFEDDKLKKMVKEHTIVRLDPQQESPFLENFKSLMPQYLVHSSGYTVTIREIENGVLDTAKVEYDSLDLSIIPAFIMGNQRFNPEYDKDSTKEFVLNDKIAGGFTCE